MLVLARKQGESIRIGEDVVLTVLHIGRGRVQIGIEAPRDVPIRREELSTPQAEWTAAEELPPLSARLSKLIAAIG